MCKQNFESEFDLTVHHIKPRKEGGKDTPSNLISLCCQCHDIAEMEQLDKDGIICYKENQENNILKKKKGLRWQQWVYGMYGRPY